MARKATPTTPVTLATLAPAVPLAKRILAVVKRFEDPDYADKVPAQALAIVLALIKAPAAAGKKETAFQTLSSAAGRIPADYKPATAWDNAGEALVSVAAMEAVRIIRLALVIAKEARKSAGV